MSGVKFILLIILSILFLIGGLAIMFLPLKLDIYYTNKLFILLLGLITNHIGIGALATVFYFKEDKK